MIDRANAKTLGIDPGATCGWSSGTGTTSGELPVESFIWFLSFVIQSYDRVAIERFSTRKLTPDSEATLEAVGAIKAICDLAGVSYGLVNASAREKTMSQVSESVTGRHARDAEAVRLWDLQYGKW